MPLLHIRAARRVRPPKPLRPLELEALRLVARVGGLTAREIARELTGPDLRIFATIGSLSIRRLVERGPRGTASAHHEGKCRAC